MKEAIKVPKLYLDLINQIFEIEKKVASLSETNSIQRNINKIKDIFEHSFGYHSNEVEGLVYHNPVNEVYNETRTDCEANIAGTNTQNLVISEVIKPIIRYRRGGLNIIVQKAVVIVKAEE